MTPLPIFLKLDGRTVVVVGGGAIAEGKLGALLDAGADVCVVAPEVTPQIAEWARAGRLRWKARRFEAGDLEGSHLAIAATAAAGVNDAVYREAEARGILCNAVDDNKNCHFYSGAVVKRGDLQIAISTNGKSPALAQRIRRELEREYGEEYAAWLDWLGKQREQLRAASRDPEQTKATLHELATRASMEEFRRSKPETARAGIALRESSATPCAKGKVYLAGAGPGDPELLTVKASRLLARADVVLHDSLVGKGVLALISPAAQVIDVGKRAGRKLLTQSEINSLLVAYSREYSVVVRLKGGDPSIFGRAGEEISALREAGVPYEIVPGVTAALGAAAAAGISLTDRRVASQVLFSTFSRGPEAGAMDWGAVTGTTTLVLYMPGPDYGEVAARLRECGLPAETPCLIVSEATNERQEIRWTSLAGLPSISKLPAPALLVVGRVASQELARPGSSVLREWDESARGGIAVI